MRKYTFPVEGMTCASCVARVEKIVKKFDGIKNISVNLASEKLNFEADDENIDVSKIAEAVEDYGYKIIFAAPGTNKPNTESPEQKELRKNDNRLRNDLIISFLLTLPVFTVSMLGDFQFFKNIWPLGIDNTNKLLFILSTFVIFIPGRRFFKIFWGNLKHFTAEMNSLIAIGSGAAYAYSALGTLFPDLISADRTAPHVYFETAVVIITLILFGRYLEERAKRKTGDAIKKLLELKPKSATVLVDGKEIKIDINNLKPGVTVIIKPGEKIPADGLLREGYSTVDESMISGESLPVEKTLDSKIIGGTINKTGSFNFTVTAVGDNSVLGQIIRMVDEAQSSKAPIQKLADKIAGIFVPAVVVIALVTFLSWLLLSEINPFQTALINSVAVLIISCPCALGLATPTAIMVATGLGASNGILIKNGESLESVNKITSIVLDKTGTITKGEPAVTDVISGTIDRRKLLRAAASLEKKSEHPLAHAILKHTESQGIHLDKVESFESSTGFGVKGIIGSHSVITGNLKIMEENSIDTGRFQKDYIRLSEEGKTLVLVSIDGKAEGLIAIEDPIKTGSKEAIDKLKKMGLYVTMITGDNEKVASAIASRSGIHNFIAGVLPDKKAEAVKNLQKEGDIVGMVGDGINDAPALVQSNVGFAIGSGTDIAIESSQITLIKGDLNDVVKSIELSRRSLKIIKQNLFWAFIYNMVGIPLAAFGLLNPMIAALAMSFSSVSVVSNSLRLKKEKL